MKMAANQLNLTIKFRTQDRVVTSLLNSVDISYTQGEAGDMFNRISNDATNNRLQEIYYSYLYGVSFITFTPMVHTLFNDELRKKGLTGFRLTSSEIGTKSEVSTYPTLRGLRVQVSTIN